MFKWVTVFKTLTWDVTSRNGQWQAWWLKSAANPSPRKIGSPVKIAFGDSFYKCLEMFYICFIMRLRQSFNSRFQEGFTIPIRKQDGIRLLTTSARLCFRRSVGPPRRRRSAGSCPEVQTLTKRPQTNMSKNVGSIKTWSAKIIM